MERGGGSVLGKLSVHLSVVRQLTDYKVFECESLAKLLKELGAGGVCATRVFLLFCVTLQRDFPC